MLLWAQLTGAHRPQTVISAGSWTPVGAADIAQAVDEAIADEADYMSSPTTGSSPATFAIGPVPAGPQTVRIRAASATAATLTVELLDAANVVLGTQTQAITATPTTYTLSYTLASPATRVRIGVA